MKENFIAEVGDTVNTTDISPLRGPFVILARWYEGEFARYDVALSDSKKKMSTLRNKDIQGK